MANFKAELYSIEQVMDFYENSDGENYKIYARMNPTESYCRYIFTGSKEDGLEKLHRSLHDLKNSGDNANEYLIQVFSNVSRKGQKPESTNITFQLNKPQHLGAVTQNNNSSKTEYLLEQLLEQNKVLVSRISAIEAEEDIEVEEPEEDGLAGILKNPEVQSMLIGAIGRFISGNAPQTAAIAGIPKSEIDYLEAVEILESLMSKGVTLEHLQLLNKMSSVKLNSLLTML